MLSSTTALYMSGKNPGTDGAQYSTITVSGTTLSFGSSHSLNTYSSSYVAGCRVSSTTALMVWVRNSDHYILGCAVGTGGAGTPVVLVAEYCGYCTIIALSTTKAVLTYTTLANDLRSVLVTLS